MDSRNRRNLSRINDELQDVQRIMMQNIDDVLQRGEQLSGEQVCYSRIYSCMYVSGFFIKLLSIEMLGMKKHVFKLQ